MRFPLCWLYSSSLSRSNVWLIHRSHWYCLIIAGEFVYVCNTNFLLRLLLALSHSRITYHNMSYVVSSHSAYRFLNLRNQDGKRFDHNIGKRKKTHLVGFGSISWQESLARCHAIAEGFTAIMLQTNLERSQICLRWVISCNTKIIRTNFVHSFSLKITE